MDYAFSKDLVVALVSFFPKKLRLFLFNGLHAIRAPNAPAQTFIGKPVQMDCVLIHCLHGRGMAKREYSRFLKRKKEHVARDGYNLVKVLRGKRREKGREETAQ